MKQMLVVIQLAFASAALAADPAAELAGFIHQTAGLDAGMAVVVNDADGRLTAALAKGNRLYVQGCSWDAKGVPAARAALLAEGVAGRASIVSSEADGIPYTDNIANLLVVPAWGSRPVDAAELLRALAPEGVGFVGNDANPAAIAGLDAKLKQAGAKDVKPLARKGWVQFSKPADREFDTWTHNLGGPDLSYVNSDKAAGPWAEVRWVGTPRWGALYMSYSGRVTAGGRLYYIENRAGKAGTEVWLVGRDAWNGLEYWRQSIGAPPKYGNAGSSLACDDTRVFCVEENTTLIARDGRTGKKLREYAPGFMPRQVTSVGSVLLTCNLGINPPVATQVVALDKDSGKTLWTRPGIVHPPAENGTAFVLTATELEGVDLVSGASRWKAKTQGAAGYIRLFCKAGVVYVVYAPPYKPPALLVAHDAATGALLWKLENPDCGYGTMAFPDELWLLKYVTTGGKGDSVSARVLNPRTGSIKRDVVAKGTVGSHCYPVKGSADYVLYSSSWTLDRTPGTSLGQGTVRSPCNLGQMPANGMTYYLPHHCDCGVALRGMLAMSRAGRKAWLPENASSSSPRLFASGAAPAAAPAEKTDDWPIYRKDTARSNFSPAGLPATLRVIWKEKLGESRLTQAVAAYGAVVVAEPQSHRVCARDAATGRERWSFVADGRLDFPPSLHKGLCLFGTAAGSVYALDAATGREVWRLRAAPAEKYIADEGQFASAWPVIGGVMPLNGEIFFTCGRAAKVDGGLWILAVDAATGKVRWRVPGGTSADMLLSDGKDLMLTKSFYNAASGARAGRQDCKGLLHTTSYLSPVAIQDYMACVEPNLAHQKHVDLTDKRITGENLAFSDKLGVAAWRYRFGVPKELMKKEKTDQRFLYAVADGKRLWLQDDNLRLQMMGVVLAGDTAYMAGVPTPPDPSQQAELWVLAGADGRKLQTLPLDSYPVYDGLSAAGGRLYLATEDGTLVCFGAGSGN